MIIFKAILQKFDEQGEKTGWTYIPVSSKIAQKLKPGNKKSFRVKGTIDEMKIKAVALIPMGEGDFIMAFNATMRKATRKRKGDVVKLSIEIDEAVPKIVSSLRTCLKDDPDAAKYFNKLPPSHQQYYSRWIESAKTEPTKTKRIMLAIKAFSMNMSFPEMMKLQRKDH